MHTPASRPSLTVAGSVNMDLVARVPQLPAPGQTVLGGALARHAGGKGANQAVAAARLGARVHFLGAVGDDAFGDELLQGLRDEGIDTSGVCRVGGASGCALINVADDGENAISVLPGANRQAPLPGPGQPLSPGLLLLQLEIPLATVCAWAGAAQQHGVGVVLNAAPMPAEPLPAALRDAVQLLIVNDDEQARLAALHPDWIDRVPRLVVTRGGRGWWARDADGTRAEGPAVAVDVVDTTGAGDTFCGALAAALLAGQAFALALVLANQAAAQACTVAGARAGMPRTWGASPCAGAEERR